MILSSDKLRRAIHVHKIRTTLPDAGVFTSLATIVFVIFALAGEAHCARDVVITAVGDILLAGSGQNIYRAKGHDYPFSGVVQELKRGDVVVGNLEGPLATKGGLEAVKKYRYRMNPAAAGALKRAGFTVLTLANNHIMDFGQPALDSTLRVLGQEGLLHVGAGSSIEEARRLAVTEASGKRIAFLAYSFTYPMSFYATGTRGGTASASAASIRADITAARRAYDHVIVSFHWGREGSRYPQPYQIKAGRAAIDAGADIVIGHHPHVLQGVEWYGRGVIFYSLGNFVFGTLSETADRSIIAHITLNAAGVSSVEIVPLNVLNRVVRYRPVALTGVGADAVTALINERSRGMDGVAIRRGNGIFVERSLTARK